MTEAHAEDLAGYVAAARYLVLTEAFGNLDPRDRRLCMLALADDLHDEATPR